MPVNPNYQAAATNQFRVQGRNLSLTWPQSDFSMDDCMTFLRNTNRNVTAVIICSEEHEDGNLHRHAYVKFSKKIDIRNARKFDFAHKHCNIQATTNVNAWINYIKQDGNFIEWYAEADEGNDDDLFELARTMTYQQYLTKCLKDKTPFAYAQRIWDTVNSEADGITFDEDPNPDLCIPFPKELSEFQLETNRTNIIVGPSGCGKTTWARRYSKKPMLFVTHIDQMKHLTNRTKSVIFDDMVFHHLPLTFQIHIVCRETQRAIHRRYGTTTTHPGLQVIMTCNERPVSWYEPINRRIKLCNIPQ